MAAGAPLPGSREDPLVTRGYVESLLRGLFDPLEAGVSALETRVAGLEERVKALREGRPVTVSLTLGKKTALVNGERRPLDSAPFLLNGRTMLPFRFLGEALGARVDWEAGTKTVTYSLGRTAISLRIGSATALVNGRPVALDAAPVLKDGRTMVPVRFVGEGLGARVDWDEKTKTITVSSKW